MKTHSLAHPAQRILIIYAAPLIKVSNIKIPGKIKSSDCLSRLFLMLSTDEQKIYCHILVKIKISKNLEFAKNVSLLIKLSIILENHFISIIHKYHSSVSPLGTES